MFGWIKKGLQTGPRDDRSDSDFGRESGGGSPGRDGNRNRPLQSLLGSRGGRRRREDEGGPGSGGGGPAALQLEGELSVRAEEILHAAFKLVREIQRILKAARETQQQQQQAQETPREQQKAAAAAGNHRRTHSGGSRRGATAAAGGAGSSSGGVLAQQSSAPSSSGGGGRRASEKQQRWAGTDELLALLNGIPAAGARPVEQAAELLRGEEAQAQMGGLVAEALQPDIRGDLCAMLLAAAAAGHPALAKLCVDAGLPSNLMHCLRIMRVVEFESAVEEQRLVAAGAAEAADIDTAGSGGGSGGGGSAPNSSSGRSSPRGNHLVALAELALTRRLTVTATARVAELLSAICRQGDAGVGEQVKPHLPGLLSLAVSTHPKGGLFVQEAALEVVTALMDRCISSSVVWLLHSRQAMQDLVAELRHLCGPEEDTVAAGQLSPHRGGGPAALAAAAAAAAAASGSRSPRRSPRPAQADAAAVPAAAAAGNDSAAAAEAPELVGSAAEAEGAWLTAVRATVCVVTRASRFVSAIVGDFEVAGGYDVLAAMVGRSGDAQLPAMLEQVAALVSAQATGSVPLAMPPSGLSDATGTPSPRAMRLLATNPAAFGVIRALLLQRTPVLRAVCGGGRGVGIGGGVAKGGFAFATTAGGGGGNGGIDGPAGDMEIAEMAALVAQKAVVMRLARWDRPMPPLSSEGTPLEVEAGSPAYLNYFAVSPRSRSGPNSLGSPDSPPGSPRRAAAVAAAALAVAAEARDVVVAEDGFRLRLLEAVLELYSNHPGNYQALEPRFHVLSLYLCALPYFESSELKGLALKTLEVVCVMFRDVRPGDALHSTATALFVCLDQMLGLLADDGASRDPAAASAAPPGAGHISNEPGSAGGGLATKVPTPRKGGAISSAPSSGGSRRSSVGGGRRGSFMGRLPLIGSRAAGVSEAVAERLDKAGALLEDADCMRRMLEKLLEFDEAKYSAVFLEAGVLENVLLPLLRRLLALDASAFPGAADAWRHRSGSASVSRPMGSPPSSIGLGVSQASLPVAAASPGKEPAPVALVTRATQLICRLLARLVGHSAATCRQFRLHRCHELLYEVVASLGPGAADAALQVLERAANADPSGVTEDMAFLIELVQGGSVREHRWRQAMALAGLRALLGCRHESVKDDWRESCGFEAAIAAVSSLDGAFGLMQLEDGEVSEMEGHEQEHFDVIRAAFWTLTAAVTAGGSGSSGGSSGPGGHGLAGHRANRAYLRHEIGYDSLTCCLVNSGVMASPKFATPAVNLLFHMLTEQTGEHLPPPPPAAIAPQPASGGSGADLEVLLPPQPAAAVMRAIGAVVRNPDAAAVVLGVLSALSENVAVAAVSVLTLIVRNGGYAEMEALVAAGAVRRIAADLSAAAHYACYQAGRRHRAAARAAAGGGRGPELLSNEGDSPGMDPRQHHLALLPPPLQLVDGSLGTMPPSPVHTAAATVSGGSPGTVFFGGSGASQRRPVENSSAPPPRCSEAVQAGLFELLLVIASHRLMPVDLPPVVRALTLPLLTDVNGRVAPPTMWPTSPFAEAAGAAPVSTVSSVSPAAISAVTAVPRTSRRSSIGTSMTAVYAMGGVVKPPGYAASGSGAAGGGGGAGTGGGGNALRWVDFEGADAHWGRLELLTAAARRAPDSVPFLRLGGEAATDLSQVCHAVVRAQQDSRDGTIATPLHKALAEASVEEGLRMVHVPLLETAGGSSGGGGSGGSSGGGDSGTSGGSWPSPGGYTFACWFRFNPISAREAAEIAPDHAEELLPLRSWAEDASTAAGVGREMPVAGYGSDATAAAGSGGAVAADEDARGHRRGRSGMSGTSFSLGTEGLLPSDDTPVARGSDATLEGGAGGGAGEQGRSRSSTGGSAAAGGSSNPSGGGSGGPPSSLSGDASALPFRHGHAAGAQLLWVASMASSCGRVFVQIYLDRRTLQICARSSAAPQTEVRTRSLPQLAAGGTASWHHLAVAHTRPKSRLLGTRDKLCFFLDAELVGSLKMDTLTVGAAGPEPAFCCYLGVPHPQALLDSSMGRTVAPAWHLGPCQLVSEPLDVELVGLMYAVGPEYTGAWGGERPLFASLASISTAVLRRLHVAGGPAGFAPLGGDVSRALQRRGLQELAKWFNVTDRIFYNARAECAQVTDAFYLLLAPEQLCFAFNARAAEQRAVSNVHASGSAGEGSGATAAASGGGGGAGGTFIATPVSAVPAASRRAAAAEGLVSAWMLNAGAESAAGAGAAFPAAAVYGSGVCVRPMGLALSLSGTGGPRVLFPLLQRAQDGRGLCATLRLLSATIRGCEANRRDMQTGGYLILAHLLREKRLCLGRDVVRACFDMAVESVPRPDNTASGGAATDYALWGWEQQLAFPPDAEVSSLLEKALSKPVVGGSSSKGAEADVGGGGAGGEFLLLTDPYGLKQIVMNHQVWGLGNRELLGEALRQLTSLVSPHNAQTHCRFNARVLHRVGIFRWVLHLMLEAAESCGKPHSQWAATLRPTAAAAAAGAEPRDHFLCNCALLLQRVLAVCVVQRDFDRIVGAALSTLADSGSRDSCQPGTDPRMAATNAALATASLLSGARESPGNVVLSGQAMVRLHLVRMLLEVLQLSGASGGYIGCDASLGPALVEGVHVFGVAASAASAATSTAPFAGANAWPLYANKGELFKLACFRALKPEWFVSLLETCGEEATVAAVLRLFVTLLQASPEFLAGFRAADGFRALAMVLPRHSASLPVALPLLAMLLGVPAQLLPASPAEMVPSRLLALFVGATGTAGGAVTGPTGVPGHVVKCLADVVLPIVRRNMAIVRAEARLRRSSTIATPATPGSGAAPSPSPPVPPLGGQNGPNTEEAAAGGEGAIPPSPPRLGLAHQWSSADMEATLGGEEAGGVGVGARQQLPGEDGRALRVNEVLLAVLRQAQGASESFARVCRSPAVIEAAVATLSEAWVAGEVGPEAPEPPISPYGGPASSATPRGATAFAAAATASEGVDLDTACSATASSLLAFLKAVLTDVVAGGSTGDRRAYAAVYRLLVASAAYVRPPARGPTTPVRKLLTWTGRGGGTTVSPSRPSPIVKLKLPPRPAPTEATAAAAAASAAAAAAAAGGDACLTFQVYMLRHVGGVCLALLGATGNLASGSSGGSGSTARRSSGLAGAEARAPDAAGGVAAAVAEATLEAVIPGGGGASVALALLLALLQAAGGATASQLLRPAAQSALLMEVLCACHLAAVSTLRRAAALGGSGSAAAAAPASTSPSNSTDDHAFFPEAAEDTLGVVEGTATVVCGGSSGRSTPTRQQAAAAAVTAAGPSPLLDVMQDIHDNLPSLLVRLPGYHNRGGSGSGGGRNTSSESMLAMAGTSDLTGAELGGHVPARRRSASTEALAAAAGGVAAQHGLGGGAGGGGSGSTSKPGKTLWEAVGSQAAGLVATAAGVGSQSNGGGGGILGARQGGSGAGGATMAAAGSSGGAAPGGNAAVSPPATHPGHWSMKDSGVTRHVGDSDTVFVTGLLAEMQLLLTSTSTDPAVRELAMKITGRLLQQRRGLVTELLGADLVQEGFELLAPPRSGPGSRAASFDGGDSADSSVARAEAVRFQGFSNWVAGPASEAHVREAFRSVTDRSYALLPHVASGEAEVAALRAGGWAMVGGSGGTVASGGELSPTGGSSGRRMAASGSYNRALAAQTPGGGQWSVSAYNPLSLRQGQGIWVDSSIARADMIAKTYERVTQSHDRWVWLGIDDLAWSARRWKQAAKQLRGEHSLWEGGVFCTLLRTPEPLIGAVEPSPGGGGGGLGTGDIAAHGMREWHWKLDLTEGPERARRRLLRNYRFFETFDVAELQIAILDRQRISSSKAAAATASAAAAAAGSGRIGATAELLLDLDEAAAAGGSSGGDRQPAVAGAAVAVGSAATAGRPLPDMDITMLVKRVSAEVGSRGRTKPARRGLFDEDDEDTAELLELDLDAEPEPEDSDQALRAGTPGRGSANGAAGRARRAGDLDAVDEASEGTPSPSPGGDMRGGRGGRGSGTSVRSGIRRRPGDPSSPKDAGDNGSGTATQTRLGTPGTSGSPRGSLGLKRLSLTTISEAEGHNSGGHGDGGGDDDGHDLDEESAATESLRSGAVSEIAASEGASSPAHSLRDYDGEDGDEQSEADTAAEARDATAATTTEAAGSETEEETETSTRSNSAVGSSVAAAGEDGGAGEDLPRLSAAVGRSSGGSGGQVPPPLVGVGGGSSSVRGAVTSGGEHDTKWSDHDVILGLMEPEDWPVASSYNVNRSVGLESRRAVLLVCRHAVYIVDGFEKCRDPAAAGNSPARTSRRISTGSSGGGSSVKRGNALDGLRRLRVSPAGTGGPSSPTSSSGGGPASTRYRVSLRRSSVLPMSFTEPAALSAKKSPNRPLGKVSEAGNGGEGGTSTGGGVENAAALAAAAAATNEAEELALFQNVGVQRIHCEQVLAVYKRRSQLRDVALEILDTQGRSVLVSLDSQFEQEEVLAAVLSQPLPNSIFARAKPRLRLAASTSAAAAGAAYRRFMQQLRGAWTKRWQAGQASNLEYLMALNTLAGRSFNDVTQYPVFPWVLADYESEQLDLTNPAIYRDLRKPMGALGETRAAQFRERYQAVVESAADVGGDPDPPAFHYGTHYSCAGYTLYYMLRLEPFSRLALHLQGGHFDKPDRLFRDVRSSWESASRENLQDVRELIPEFYFLPEFLLNANRFDLGVTQRGQPVHHVVLPPWAGGDPRQFIRLHRQALESEHVSRNLHHWIDLIFGYKQRGPDAVNAQNVFVHLTYEGEVDVDAIEDPLLREATIAQIHNFGQTPSRLFKKPHPPRDAPAVVRVGADGQRSVDVAAIAWHQHLSPPLCIVGAPENVALKAVSLASAGSGGGGGGGGVAGGEAVGDCRLAKDKVVGVSRGALLLPRAYDKYVRFGGPNCGVSFHAVLAAGKGAQDKTLSVHSDLHLAPVTAVACTEDGALLVTGARDATLRLWRVLPHASGGAGSLAKSLELRATLTGHAGEITCVDANAEVGNAVSGGADHLVLVWDLRRQCFLRELPGHHQPINSVSINGRNGNMVTLAGVELRVWTVNGDLLARSSVTALRRTVPTCAAATDCPDWQDGVVAVTGHLNGEVALWGIRWAANSGNRQTQARSGGGRGEPEAGRPMTPSSASNEALGGGGGGGGGAGSATPDLDQSGGLLGGRYTPTRPLALLRVLSGAHTRAITCVRVCGGQRELLAGDCKGQISRWQCIRLDQLTGDELNLLLSER